jgi:putative ABC transport system permease protein
MRVVGETLAPIFCEADVGEVGAITFAGLEAAGGDSTEQFVLTRLRGGGSDAQLRELRRDYTEEIITDAVPARIVNLHRVRRLPVVGILVAGLLGTIVLVYTLAISARARSRELAVLRALGLASRQLRGVLAWQGAVLGLAMVVLGIPIGLLLGIAAWHRVADGLGVGASAVLSPWIWLLVPLALLVAVGASLLPAHRARRAPVADVLRAE